MQLKIAGTYSVGSPRESKNRAGTEWLTNTGCNLMNFYSLLPSCIAWGVDYILSQAQPVER